MSSVDDRIVNMKFNNSQFGQGVDKSKRDLTGLEKTVASVGKSKGMTDLGNSVQQVSTKFSALQVAGVTALGTIVAKATAAGINLVKSLTIQPIIDGFKEYQTNLESVQTIMANTGKSVKVVNHYLDELNEFSDQTIYNFSQMAKNIGTFTAAGVELNTATSAIKGIANLAALSGSTSDQASRAMYQLSQAIAAGKVGLMDWNSVVNAGMGGKVFKNALAQTAVAMGELSAGAVKVGTDVTIMGSSFRNSISAAPGQISWLTSDILVKTLASLDGRFSETRMKVEGYNKASERQIMLDKERVRLAKQGVVFSDEEFEKMVATADRAYAAATQIKTFPQLLTVVRESIGSMFASGFEVILGDFEQSKKLWGSVGKVITGPNGIIPGISSSFLGALRIWEKRGGRDKLIIGLSNAFGGLLDVLGTVKDAFGDVFPDSQVSVLFRMSKAFKSFTKSLVPSERTLESLRSIFGGVFAILHIGVTVLKGISEGFRAFFSEVFKGTKSGRGGILSFLGSIGEVLKAIDRWVTQGGKLSDFLEGLGRAAGMGLRPIIEIVGLVVQAFANLASGKGIGAALAPIDQITNMFIDFIGTVLGGVANLTAPFEKVSGFFEGLRDKVANMSGTLESSFGSMGGGSISTGGFSGIIAVFDQIVAGAKNLGGIVSDAFNDASAAMDRAAEVGQNVGEKISTGFGKVRDTADDVKTSTKGIYDSISGSASSAAAAGTEQVAAGAESVGSVFSAIGGVIKTVADGVSDALGWMVEKLSSIPFPDDALEWATVLNALISGALIKKLFFSKGLFGQLRDTIQDVGKAVEQSFGQLTDTLKTMQNSVRADMIKNIAIAVALLVASLVALSFLPMDKLKQGLGAISVILTEMGLLLLLLSKLNTKMGPAQMIAMGGALVLMASAVAILTGAVAALAFIPFENLKQGLGAVAVVLTMMSVSLLALSGQSAKVAAVGAAMTLMATAIGIMVPAIVALGLLPFEKVKQGLAAVAYGVAIMTVSLLALSGNSAKILAAGGAMVLMATALDILVVAITTLGLLPWDVVEQGLKAVAYGLGIMTLSLMALSAGGPSVLAAGAAMVMIAGALTILTAVIVTLGSLPWDVVSRGLGALALGLLIVVAAAGLATLVLPGMAALAVVIKAIGLAMLATGAGFFLFASGLAILAALGTAAIAVITLAIGAFIALLPNIAVQVAAAFVTFIQAIALAAPKIRKAFSTIFKEMLGTIRDALPEIGKLMSELIDTGLDVLVNAGSDFAEAGYQLIDNILRSAAEHVPNIVDSAFDLIEFFVNELASRAVDLADAGLDMVVDVLNGISDAVENSDRVRDAAWNLVRTFADEVREAMAETLGNINPLNYLPDVSLSDLKGAVGLGRVKGNAPLPGDLNFRKKSPLETAIEETGIKVANAVENAVRLLANAVSGPLYQLAKEAAALKKAATFEGVRAEQQSISADAALSDADTMLSDAQGMKGKAKFKKGKPQNKKAKRIAAAKKAQKEAEKQRRAADRQADRAAIAQIKADYADQKARDEIMYKDDLQGFGDAKSSQGQDLADQAAQLQASAEAKAAEIKRLENLAKESGKNGKKYRDQAAQLRKEAAAETAQAMLLAAQGMEAMTAAVNAYAEARKNAALETIAQMQAIRERQAEEQKQREWQEAYDKADDATKKSMLEARKFENEQRAAAAQQELAKQLAIADNLAAAIAAGYQPSDADLAAVQAAALEAEKQAAIVAQAMDAVEADRQAIEQMTTTTASNNTTGGGGSNLIPSRTALEDAAKAVDRYTASVAQAEEMAVAGSSAPQFIQNNYSPEALSASTIYRQSKNLISAAEVKMGATD